jgi:hypothetical protein
MSFQTTAQDRQLLVVDPSALQPLEVEIPADGMYLGDHLNAPLDAHKDESVLEVQEPVDIEIVVGDLPGAPDGTPDPEPLIEISDSPLQVEENSEGSNDAKKSSKNEKWDWSKHGPHGFIIWIQERLAAVPKHSGYDTAGLERAIAYMEKLDSEISKAMRMDLDEELDANKVEEIRAKIDDGISRLQDRLDKVKESKKSSRRKKRSAEEESGLMIKEAQKILGVQGIYIMAPLLISGIARICINGTISAGHDIEDLYKRQVKQWKLNDREQFELRQLLFDMGFPVRADRGALPEEDYDVASNDNMDWAANYKG